MPVKSQAYSAEGGVLMLAVMFGLLIGITTMVSATVQAAGFPIDLGRWYVTDPPTVGSDQWWVANNDVEHEWTVTLGAEGPRVSPAGGERDVRSVLPFEIKPSSTRDGPSARATAERVKDGWLVAFDAGEFGAEVWWYSPDGAKRYKVSDDHVLCFVPTNSGLLAFSGLAHGGQSQGRVIHLQTRADGQWRRAEFLDLGHAPQAVVKDTDGAFIVATTDRLVRIVPASKKIEVILSRAFWTGLYPNSIVVAPSGAIFVGMRHGVAKIEKGKTAYKVHWLLPSKKFADAKTSEGFKCQEVD